MAPKKVTLMVCLLVVPMALKWVLDCPEYLACLKVEPTVLVMAQKMGFEMVSWRAQKTG